MREKPRLAGHPTTRPEDGAGFYPRARSLPSPAVPQERAYLIRARATARGDDRAGIILVPEIS